MHDRKPDLGLPRELCEGVFLVGGPGVSGSQDALSYLVKGSSARVLVDCGSGPSIDRILALAGKAGGGPPTHLLLTHAHIDHCGGAAQARRKTGCQVLIHKGDAAALENGDPVRSAAGWYGLTLEPTMPDLTLTGGEEIPLENGEPLHIVHAPGHTPGSLVAWADLGGKRVLFGQDVHGPFSPQFGSDLTTWAYSMRGLLELQADILCEGHFGVFQPAGEVEGFIKSQLTANGFQV